MSRDQVYGRLFVISSRSRLQKQYLAALTNHGLSYVFVLQKHQSDRHLGINPLTAGAAYIRVFVFY